MIKGTVKWSTLLKVNISVELFYHASLQDARIQKLCLLFLLFVDHFDAWTKVWKANDYLKKKLKN